MSTQEKPEDIYVTISRRKDMCFGEVAIDGTRIRLGDLFFRMLYNEDLKNTGSTPKPEHVAILQDLVDDVRDLIDSAKREAVADEYRRIIEKVDVFGDENGYMPNSSWKFFFSGRIRELEQSEELSACCGAEITETRICTDCYDNC